ncbi:MAG: HAD family hydrolase [Nanoarchaeota archaeon]|nr:HAD family hydrolase [Nanoarchaeota archaeon]MBU1030357.1 HAD family hydrolase [Nanoarchaeota archaeon]
MVNFLKHPLFLISRMKLIIFDVDGTLEREEEINKVRFKAQIKKISVKYGWSEEEAKKQYFNMKEKLGKKAVSSVNVATAFGFSRQEYFDTIDFVDPKNLVAAHDNCELVLKELKKKHKLVAYSNTPEKSTNAALKFMKILNYFDKVYTVDMFEESKPSTENLIRILNDYKVKPKDAIMIGNSYEKDILPPKTIGMNAILFDPEKTHKKKSSEYKVISNLIELVGFFK